MLFTNFSEIVHAFDKISSYPPHNCENIFLFSPGAQSAKKSAALHIRPGISQNNTLLGNAAVSPSLSAAVWAVKDSNFSKFTY